VNKEEANNFKGGEALFLPSSPFAIHKPNERRRKRRGEQSSEKE